MYKICHIHKKFHIFIVFITNCWKLEKCGTGLGCGVIMSRAGFTGELAQKAN
jgi:hypothetical protein